MPIVPVMKRLVNAVAVATLVVARRGEERNFLYRGSQETVYTAARNFAIRGSSEAQ